MLYELKNIVLDKFKPKHANSQHMSRYICVTWFCFKFQVLSGDTIIIRGQPKGGPPPEKTIGLTNVQAPKLARRPQVPENAASEPKDEVLFKFQQNIDTIIYFFV